jgi:hypothetical protein
MSALPHAVDVGRPAVDTRRHGHGHAHAHAQRAAIGRPAWLHVATRATRVVWLCCLVLLVPGEADRFASGASPYRG